MISALMPLCFGALGIGTHEAHAPVGVMRARRPHLLAVHNELVADELGARLQAGEVAAGAGLAHAETPRDLGAQRRKQEAFLLLRRSVVVDRRSDDPETLRVRAAQDLARAHLLEVDHLLGRASRCVRRARAASPAPATRRRTGCAATSAPNWACARSTASVRGTALPTADARRATRRARRETLHPRASTAAA